MEMRLQIIRQMDEDQFSEIKQAFMLIDEDASGTLSTEEMEFALN